MADWQDGWAEAISRIVARKPIEVFEFPPALLAELCTASLAMMNTGDGVEQAVAHGFYQWWQYASRPVVRPSRPADISGGTKDKKLDIWLEYETIIVSERIAGNNFVYARIKPDTTLRDARPFVELLKARLQEGGGRNAWEARIKRDLKYAYEPGTPERELG